VNSRSSRAVSKETERKGEINRERKRQRERKRKRQSTATKRETDRQERERERQTDKDRERDKDRVRVAHSCRHHRVVCCVVLCWLLAMVESMS
jgi:hypothetical protein